MTPSQPIRVGDRHHWYVNDSFDMFAWSTSRFPMRI